MDIDNYEGYYQVSNLGRVKSLERRVKNYPSGTRFIKSAPLKTRVGTTGYLTVDLCKKGRASKYKIHRLKAIAFIPNPKNYPQINHIDGNKLNNDLSNLEWCSSASNILHAYSCGLHKSKLSAEYVEEILNGYPEISIPKLAMKYNVSNTAIWYVIHGKNCKRLNK